MTTHKEYREEQETLKSMTEDVNNYLHKTIVKLGKVFVEDLTALQLTKEELEQALETEDLGNIGATLIKKLDTTGQLPYSSEMLALLMNTVNARNSSVLLLIDKEGTEEETLEKCQSRGEFLAHTLLHNKLAMTSELSAKSIQQMVGEYTKQVKNTTETRH